MGKIFGFDKHSVYGWIGHAEHIQDEHYLQITDDHLKAGCGIEPDRQVVADSSLIAPHAPSAKTQTLQNKAFPVIDRHGPSVGIPQVGDEGLYGTRI